jgi:predicted glycoside hydrolase/deacetylase ChbG (UPF0249 family)
VLYVNADDLGRSAEETDRAIECLAANRISSATAMVFMENSQRAADLTRGKSWDIGLHLNLSEQLSSAEVIPRLRERHERISRFLLSSKYALVLFNPLLARDFDYVVKAQIGEFSRLYGHPPSRLDGHQHMHLATNVLWQGLIPSGLRVRRSFSFDPGEKGSLNRWYRARIDTFLGARYKLTDKFYGLSGLLDLSELAKFCRLAETVDVELMTHPQRADEYRLLMSDEFLALTAGTRSLAARADAPDQLSPRTNA